MQDGLQEEPEQIPAVEEESSWEVQSSAGSEELSESGEESDYESSGDEVLRHSVRKRAALS